MVKFAMVILIATTVAGSALADPLDDATAAYKHGDYATTLELLLPLADGGNRAAQHNLGAFFADGQGDFTEAERWFRKAADQGLAESQFNLGVLYQNGRGVPQDYRQSAMWYRNAAGQGDARAQLNLGAMYANGEGVPRDYVEAYRWLNLAAANLPASQSASRELAVNGRDKVAARMTPAQLAEAENLAKAWTPE
jgi:TPR repeat protein